MILHIKNTKIVFCLFILLFSVSGCTTVQYNGSPKFIREVSYPDLNQIVTAYVGDHLLEKGNVIEVNVLEVKRYINGVLYDIPPKLYEQIGHDSKNDYYDAEGVIKAALADPIQALALKKQEDSQLCVVTTFGGKACYKGEYERKTQLSENENSFQQTLIYRGRIGDKINIGYREFRNNLARPAFNVDVEYDLTDSKTIGYKKALIEVLEANNNSIKYKVIRNFD